MNKPKKSPEKHEFSHTILNPIDLCIQRLEAHQSGRSRFFTSYHYQVSRIDKRHYSVESSGLKADLYYHDTHKTIVRGLTTGLRGNLFFTVLWCSLHPAVFVYFLSLEYNLSIGISCGILAHRFMIMVYRQLEKLAHESAKQHLLKTISATEPEKKKKHA